MTAAQKTILDRYAKLASVDHEILPPDEFGERDMLLAIGNDHGRDALLTVSERGLMVVADLAAS